MFLTEFYFTLSQERVPVGRSAVGDSADQRGVAGHLRAGVRGGRAEAGPAWAHGSAGRLTGGNAPRRCPGCPAACSPRRARRVPARAARTTGPLPQGRRSAEREWRGAGISPEWGSEKPSSPRDSRRGQSSCGQRRARPAALPLASGRGLGLLRAAEPRGAVPLPDTARQESWRGRSRETFSCSGSADSSALIQIYRYSSTFFAPPLSFFSPGKC